MGKNMKKNGVELIFLSFLIAILAFNMDVTVGHTYNIGLLSERQNIIFLSCVLFLAGIILYSFGQAKVDNEAKVHNKAKEDNRVYAQLG
jgi:hypothetical protein